ncbi:MAG: hypothetical protein K9J37_13575 [Saprospiraceae bacterium]|nr:hypothetical protein [Saprospiraceae bacterium]MCF8250939.1 hypothetical protein [Saprospiraceae bacterium]MCF8281917.1 hypothetical protein [Bacteroidales bacterium]MCF8311904.1 hypothetical protein [Saprospiraceae bacterium]MCF8441912.1 hypothetical protein [Saprospiraceae bacterium]
MKLDRSFVKSLRPALSKILPHGQIKAVAEKTGFTPLTARNAINGASTNEEIIVESLKSIIRLDGDIQSMLSQVPSDLVLKWRDELKPHPTGA